MSVSYNEITSPIITVITEANVALTTTERQQRYLDKIRSEAVAAVPISTDPSEWFRQTAATAIRSGYATPPQRQVVTDVVAGLSRAEIDEILKAGLVRWIDKEFTKARNRKGRSSLAPY